MLANGTTLRLAAASNQNASAWLPTLQNVSATFSTTFQFQISKVDPSDAQIGDGFAFVIQSAAAGTHAIGSAGFGQYLGYNGLNKSLAIEFDTYQNSNYNDPANPHIGIQSNGAGSNSPDHNGTAKLATPVQANFADGSVHTATVTYDGTTLKVFLDGSAAPVISATVGNLGTLLGLTGGNAYVGFTAANGSAREFADILTWSW